MSFALVCGTQPEGIVALTGTPPRLWLQLPAPVRGVVFTGTDFAELVKYWLTNADLVGERDPRKLLVHAIQGMRIVPGYNAGGKRLEFEHRLSADVAIRGEIP